MILDGWILFLPFGKASSTSEVFGSMIWRNQSHLRLRCVRGFDQDSDTRRLVAGEFIGGKQSGGQLRCIRVRTTY